jgi:hypothetical protein
LALSLKGWEGAKMDKGKLVGVLAAVLAVSICLNVVLYSQDRSVSQQQKDFAAYYSEFGNVSLQSVSYNFSPPVSMYRALKIALYSGGWNATSLENMTVSVSLEYCKFWSDSSIIKSPYDNTTLGPSSGSGALYPVTQPAEDYSAVTVKNATYSATYRYLWDIVVKQNSGVLSIPPPGLYWIDTASAEIIPTGPLY